MTDIEMEISIPTDSDGFVLLQCPLCREYFKLTPDDIEDEAMIEMWCPNCGLKADNYLTEDVINIAKRLARNSMADMINQSFKDIEHSFQNSLIKFTRGEPIKKYAIDPIQAKIENLEVKKFNCCSKQAKISPNLMVEGGYCPFCGEVND